MSTDFKLPCRLCYDSNTAQVDICHVRVEDWDIPLMIHRLFGFQILSENKLPTVICSPCIKYVKGYYDFYIKVKEVQQTFLRKISTNDENNKKLTEPLMNKLNFKAHRTRSLNRKKPVKDSKNVFIKTEPVYSEHIYTIDSHENPLDPGLRIKEEENCDLPVANLLKIEIAQENKSFLTHSCNEEELPEDSDVGNGQTLLIDGQEIVDTASEDDAPVDAKKSSVTFPDTIYKDGRLTITGGDLDNLLKKFYNIQCDTCATKPKFSTCNRFFEHFERRHKTRGYITCCGSQLKTRKQLISHMVSHVQPDAFKCQLCKRIFRSPTSMFLHMKRHLPDSEKDHKCDECTKAFISMAALKTHKVIHLPIELREIFNCKECDKSFNVERYYLNHVKQVHTTERHLCPVCGNNFKTKCNLDSHMYTHDPDGKHRIQCEDCGFICKSRYTLSVHKKKHSAKRIHCTLCDYNTYLSSNLRLHMKIKHSDDKPFVCEVCGKGFKMSINLKTHMAQHTGERKYTCTFCSRMFVSAGNCYSHRKRMHPEQHKDIVIAKQLDILRKKPKIIPKTPEKT